MQKAKLTFAALTALVSIAVAQDERTPGTVVSTMDAEGYTYVQIDVGGETRWFAVPATELRPGERVIASAGMPMQNFRSKTLDRTFDVVYFAESITRAGAPEQIKSLPAGHPPIESATCPAPDSAGFDFSGIQRPEGAKTVAEIYEESAALAGKSVLVRGIAVKVNANIMGKNWIHLQDGTGQPGCDNLTVTTTNTVEAGATVTATGILATNLDFGYGYNYAVLLQDAVLQ